MIYEDSVANTTFFKMANEAEQVAYIAEHADSELSFIFADAELEVEWQYKIVLAGFKNLRRFAGLEDTREKVREALVSELGLKMDEPGAKLTASVILSAWEAAREQMTREAQLRAEARAARVPRQITDPERVAMRRVIESRFGKLDDDLVPAASYLSTKLDETEQNEPRASTLDEVVSLDDAEDFAVNPTEDLSGLVRMVRKKQKVTLPTTPEELRRRLRVEGNVWLFLSTKYTNRPWLANLTPQVFEKLADYVLGRRVNDMQVRIEGGPGQSGGLRNLSPPWTAVLHYEHEVRKKALWMVREEGARLCDSIPAACKDSETKEIHFTTPIVLMPHVSRSSGSQGAGTKRATPSAPGEQTLSKRQRQRANKAADKQGKGGQSIQTGQGKGKGKGGKTGKGGGRRPDVLSRTPDGRMICYTYNRKPAGQCGGGCGMVHCCQFAGCHGDHPIFDCIKAQAAGVPDL